MVDVRMEVCHSMLGKFFLSIRGKLNVILYVVVPWDGVCVCVWVVLDG